MNSKFLSAASILGGVLLIGATINLRSENAQTIAPGNSSATPQETPAPTYKLLIDADVQQAFREIPEKPPTNKKIFDEKHYNVAVARVAKRNGPPEQHRDSDRIFFIKEGAARMRIGGRITDPEETAPGEYRSKSGSGYTNYDEIELKAGSVLSVPRNIVYQIIAENVDISFIVVRIN